MSNVDSTEQWNPLNSWCENGCCYLAGWQEPDLGDGGQTYAGLLAIYGSAPVFCDEPAEGFVQIYILMDERFQPRYVGQTKHPRRRYFHHMNTAHKMVTHKDKWIMSVVRGGHLPQMVPWFGPVPESEWESAERKAIAFLRTAYKLTNATDGGPGQIKPEDNQRGLANSLAVRRGRPLADTHKALVSQGLAEFYASEDGQVERGRRAERAKGVEKSPELLARMSEIHRSPELLQLHIDVNAGEANHQAKLTQADVDEIRRRFAEGATAKALAREYGMGETQMGRIRHGRSWKVRE